MLSRGLVISPPIVVDGQSLHIKHSNIDPSELRFSLLYWDKLVWPSSRIIHLESNDDENFLEEVGVLSRPEYSFNGYVSHSIAASQIQAFHDHEKTEPGSWAMAIGESSLLIKDANFEQGKGALIELHRAIPVPSGEVPLNEILEFKVRRKDELLAMRHHLDQLFLEVQSSSNVREALEKKIGEVDSACADLLKVGKEWQFPVHVSNLKASFSISARTVGPWVAGGWLVGQSFGLPAAAAVAATAAVLSSLEIKGDLGLRSPRRPPSPYRYAFKALEELR
jgi:hypothetical protein